MESGSFWYAEGGERTGDYGISKVNRSLIDLSIVIGAFVLFCVQGWVDGDPGSVPPGCPMVGSSPIRMLPFKQSSTDCIDGDVSGGGDEDLEDV